MAFCNEAKSQNNCTSIRLYFEQGSTSIDDKYHLEKLKQAIRKIELDTLVSLQKIEITGFSSPEGSVSLNSELAHKRAKVVADYLTEQLGLPTSKIHYSSRGVDWDEIKRIAQQHGVPNAEGLQLTIQYGTPPAYVTENIYPLLRKSQVDIYSHRTKPTHTTATLVETPTIWVEDEAPELVEPEVEVEIEVEIEEPVTIYRPLLALKSNLLFDAATLINFEAEVPLGAKWSLAAEYIFPWWTMDNNKANSSRNRIQLQNITLEGRHWWGNRSERPILTGWFTGIYAGVGSYDFEHNGKGYQGEILFSAGVSGGYAHTINRAKSLRLEYSLGVGYLGTDYKYYHAEFCNNGCWHAIEQRRGRYRWVGPTRARISLSWLIDYKRRR